MCQHQLTHYACGHNIPKTIACTKYYKQEQKAVDGRGAWPKNCGGKQVDVFLGNGCVVMRGPNCNTRGAAQEKTSGGCVIQ
jgi:hypothetical protein